MSRQERNLSERAQAAILAAVPGTGGRLSEIADRAGYSYHTVAYHWRKYPALCEAIIEERERILDLAERKLAEQIEAGNKWAIEFVLETIGKNRGYTKRQELDVEQSTGDVTLMIVAPPGEDVREIDAQETLQIENKKGEQG